MINNHNKYGKSTMTFRRTGDTECYYSYAENIASPTISLYSGNIIYSMLFYMGSVQRIADQIVIRVITIGTALNARLGIYLDNGNIYPGTLLLDAGSVDISVAGVKTINISQVLPKNTIIFCVMVMDGTATIRTFGSTTTFHPLGKGSTLGTGYNMAHTHAQSYGELPNPFPTASPTLKIDDAPGIYLRFSS